VQNYAVAEAEEALGMKGGETIRKWTDGLLPVTKGKTNSTTGIVLHETNKI
jgi:hypothetical protein